MSRPRPRAQIGMDDKWIEDAELEQLLEERQVLKDECGAMSKKLKAAAEAVTVRLKVSDLFPGEERRCGRWLIGVRRLAARSVSFDIAASERTMIRVIEAERAGEPARDAPA